jgi:hypothetical protein
LPERHEHIELDEECQREWDEEAGDRKKVGELEDEDDISLDSTVQGSLSKSVGWEGRFGCQLR